MESDSYKYYWDNDLDLNRSLISFDSFEDLGKITINGLNAQELLNKQKIDLKIIGDTKNLSTKLYDHFGEIIIEYEDKVLEKIRIAPWKLSKGLGTPEDVFNYVSNDIFQDISFFLSYVIKSIQENIKSIDKFSYQILKKFPTSYDFLVNLLAYNNRLLENSISNLYSGGPIHKEINIKTDYTGSQLVLSSLISPSPYNFYIKRQHTHDTLLNQMLFQSAYFSMQASKLIEERLDNEHKYLQSKTEKIFQNSNKLLNQYDLWTFFSLDTLDDYEIRSKLISLNNPFYMEVYKVFRIVRDIIIYLTLIAALRLEKGVEMALKEFYTIYEIWTISKLWKTFHDKGFDLKNVELGSIKLEGSNNSISTRLVLNLVKDNFKVKILWGIHLDPTEHSNYYGGLIRGLNLKDRDTKINPDVTIIMECMDLKKVLIGDVKFKLKKGNSSLPRLESLYKVLSYMEDLKESPVFKRYKVEGLLIYPGDMNCAKTPEIENENYINVTPLNMFNQDFGIITKI